MHSKSPLLDELAKRVNHNLQADSTDIEDDDDDYSSDEDELDDELPLWIKLHKTFVNSLFILNEKYTLLCLLQFCFEVGSKTKFLV